MGMEQYGDFVPGLGVVVCGADSELRSQYCSGLLRSQDKWTNRENAVVPGTACAFNATSLPNCTNSQAVRTRVGGEGKITYEECPGSWTKSNVKRQALYGAISSNTWADVYCYSRPLPAVPWSQNGEIRVSQTNLEFHDIGDTLLGCNFGIQVYPTEGLQSGPDVSCRRVIPRSLVHLRSRLLC